MNRKLHRLALGLALAFAGVQVSCSSYKAKEPYRYVYIPGKTAMVTADGMAVAPRSAPAAVHRAIQAGNELQGKPYVYGGGHARLCDNGYDCSGSVSYVLNRSGLMRGSMASQGFRKFGAGGQGDWITVYAKDGHAFIVVAGLRLDTGGGSRDTGPQWKPYTRGTKGFVMRHPSGL